MPVRRRRPARGLLAARDLIAARYAEPLDVPSLARAVGLRSAGSFTTRFGRIFGMTPTAYRAAHSARPQMRTFG
jgi:AraC-like DNA-binding protein